MATRTASKVLMEMLLTQDKVTPGTVRFSAENEAGRKISQYVPKAAFGSDPVPEQIRVTVTVA